MNLNFIRKYKSKNGLKLSLSLRAVTIVHGFTHCRHSKQFKARERELLLSFAYCCSPLLVVIMVVVAIVIVLMRHKSIIIIALSS